MRSNEIELRYPKTFDAFMIQVDGALLRLANCSTLDLPDFDYCSAYEASEDPKRTARRAYRAAGGN